MAKQRKNKKGKKKTKNESLIYVNGQSRKEHISSLDAKRRLPADFPKHKFWHRKDNEYKYRNPSYANPMNIHDEKAVDANFPPGPIRMLAVGTSGSGKTTFLLNTIVSDNIRGADYIVIMAQSIIDQPLYNNMCRACMYTDVSPEELGPLPPGAKMEDYQDFEGNPILKNIIMLKNFYSIDQLKTIPQFKRILGNPNICFIVDDFTDRLSTIQQDLCAWLTRSRSRGWDFICVSHGFFNMSPTLRKNINVYMLFKGSMDDQMSEINLHQAVCPYVYFKYFKDIYFKYVQRVPYGFLVFFKDEDKLPMYRRIRSGIGVDTTLPDTATYLRQSPDILRIIFMEDMHKSPAEAEQMLLVNRDAAKQSLLLARGAKATPGSIDSVYKCSSLAYNPQISANNPQISANNDNHEVEEKA
jgi:hypothetical protein